MGAKRSGNRLQQQALPYLRHYPIGAELVSSGGAHFRVWAPESKSVAVQLSPDLCFSRHRTTFCALNPEPEGFHSGLVATARAGMLYRFQLARGACFPDPASRFQPEGPHGPSQLVDPRDFRWTDHDWPGIAETGRIIYEMHIGTFTQEGTWKAACRELPSLAELGITIVEVMPVADFPGRFGWGYDGVNLFAPTRLYGLPNDFRRFVDRAHSLQMGVILDVVYNHFGPDGNYLTHFSSDYFTDRYKNEWGEPINFDGRHSIPVREFFLTNAAYWIEEFHLDGLRLDAVQQIFDSSPTHIVDEIGGRVRQTARRRRTYVVAEDEPQKARLVRPSSEGGFALDGVWNDDFHHCAHVALTGRSEAYYKDYRGTPQEFISAVKWGFLYQGQYCSRQRKRRGTPTYGISPSQFVNCLQNHDQVANSMAGCRLHELAHPGQLRALTALLLLGPGTPMLFQGQEFAASTPFTYFAEHNPDLAPYIAKGRREFVRQFESLSAAAMDAWIPKPSDEAVFRGCKLRHEERTQHTQAYALHRDLLRLRREDPVFSQSELQGVDGAVLGSEAFVIRFFSRKGRDRLLLVNLGTDLIVSPAPEPLLAPPLGMAWRQVWHSETPEYGGQGGGPLDTAAQWRLTGKSAIVLSPVAPADGNRD